MQHQNFARCAAKAIHADSIHDDLKSKQFRSQEL